MDDPDPPSVAQERSVATAPGFGLGPIGNEAGDVVAAIVVDDQESTPGSGQSLGGGHVQRIGSAQGGPQSDDHIGSGVRGVPAAVAASRRDPQPCPERAQLVGPQPTIGLAVEEHDIAVADRPERFQRARDLAFDVEGMSELTRERGVEGEREVCHRREYRVGATIDGMIDRIRAMPGGIRLFLLYAALILVGIALSLRVVIDQAIAAPISPLGILVMVLLAYTIFTTTLVLQRKQAARGLALGLSSLVIPAVLILATSPVHPATPFFVAAFGLLLFRGMLRPEVRTYLDEP